MANAPPASLEENHAGDRMNIWILNHYAGTATSTSTRHYDLGKELAQKGHAVTIFASGFNHHKFVEERFSRGERWKTENQSGVRFIWIKTAPYKGNGWRRVVNVLSYAWRVIWIGRRIKEKPDVIIGSCVHPFAVLSAYILSIIKKSRFFFEVRDLWPQTLIDMGALSEKGPVAIGLRIMEKFLYRKAEKIITLLPYADKYITRLGIPKEKIVWIPNGADLSRYEKIKKYTGEISRLFTVLYLGSYGKANALDNILDAAKILQDKGRIDVRFVFIGDGPEKKSLINYSRLNNIKNVEFGNSVPKDCIYKELEKADAFVLPLKDVPVFEYGISSNKLFDYLAAGRPILFSGNATNNPVHDAGAGICVPPENPEALANAVAELINKSPAERIKMGENGMEYVKKYHDIRLLADKLAAMF